MPIVHSRSGETGQIASIAELEDMARQMRAWNLLCLHAAGSGHSGGTLSVMDIAAVLYLRVVRHDPKRPDWPERDRVFWSAGHKAPALYVALAFSGYFDKRECLKLRKYGSGFEGHPNRAELPGIEISSGSLGQGLSVAVGAALAARLEGSNGRIVCIMGDGEHQEGQIWEAVTAAAHYKLDKLIGIVDQNRLQIDGKVEDVMNVFPLAEKYAAFGWHVIETDGHDVGRLVAAFDEAHHAKDRPTVILADTVKGKGVSFMEDVTGWHGKAPNREQLEQALAELHVDWNIDELLAYPNDYQRKVDDQLRASTPAFRKDYGWNAGGKMQVDMQPTRMGFGRCLAEEGDDPRVCCLGADISDSIVMSGFYKDHPERLDRWFSMGIAEQSATCVAAGLAKEGRIAVFGTYGVFAAGRALDQLRTTVCYNNLNVKIAGAHGGISVGPDGATHQALEEFSQMCALPNMHVVAGVDAVETRRLTKMCLFDVDGPCYLRFAREATPVVTTDATPLTFGKANVVRFRRERPHFADAFEHILADQYRSEGEVVAVISNGPELAEAMRAAWILKAEHGIETRVINLHTVKPLDERALVAAARDCGVVLTVEEHQIGGLGNLVAGAVLRAGLQSEFVFDSMGIPDRFGTSGGPWELLRAFDLSAEHIAAQALVLIERRDNSK